MYSRFNLYGRGNPYFLSLFRFCTIGCAPSSRLVFFICLIITQEIPSGMCEVGFLFSGAPRFFWRCRPQKRVTNLGWPL